MTSGGGESRVSKYGPLMACPGKRLRLRDSVQNEPARRALPFHWAPAGDFQDDVVAARLRLNVEPPLPTALAPTE
jgi:hypothetical protein